MLDRRFLVAVAIAPILGALAPLACGSAGTATSDDGGGANGEAGIVVGPTGEGGFGEEGGVVGNPGDAATPIGSCAASSAACTVATDCCSGACVSGACSAAQCISIGDACPSAGNACCTGNCTASKCASITANPTCTTAGNACTANTACCSGLCTNGTCNIASSFCIQPNDICFDAADCCTGSCQSPNTSPVSAANPGTCGPVPKSGGVNCTGVDGTLCNPSDVGCPGGCCSALCAPYGPTGVAICQQAQGCHVEGDLCRIDGDCCGGESPDAGVLGGGLVVCSTSVNGGTIGVCMTPTAKNGGGSTCVPEGDVCHYDTPPYACAVSAKRSDCCGPQKPPFLACQLDKLGVPRCLAYGLDDGGACRHAGNACATAGDCCDGAPCVPNAQGDLACASTSCIPTSGACTSSADCCAGITCVVPVGALAGTCVAASPPTGSTTDGGSSSGSDAGAGLGCASIGQSCASFGCCTDLTCGGGQCSLPPK